MILTSHDGIAGSFRQLGITAREVMMEQLSKAGNDVQTGMRTSMRSLTTKYKTRVGLQGAYLKVVGSREFGLRESMTVDNKVMSPKSMDFAINSFLMEKSDTLVVGGANPAFIPLKRRNGEVVGSLGRVGKVGRQTIAIIDRMDTGEERGEYPIRTQLGNMKGRNFMANGVSRASGSVRSRLSAGWVSVMGKAVNNLDVREIVKRYG